MLIFPNLRHVLSSTVYCPMRFGEDGADAVVASQTKTADLSAATAKAVDEQKIVLTITTPFWIDNDEYVLVELCPGSRPQAAIPPTLSARWLITPSVVDRRGGFHTRPFLIEQPHLCRGGACVSALFILYRSLGE